MVTANGRWVQSELSGFVAGTRQRCVNLACPAVLSARPTDHPAAATDICLPDAQPTREPHRNRRIHAGRPLALAAGFSFPARFRVRIDRLAQFQERHHPIGRERDEARLPLSFVCPAQNVYILFDDLYGSFCLHPEAMPDRRAFNLCDLWCLPCGVPQDAEEQTEKYRIALKCWGWPILGPEIEGQLIKKTQKLRYKRSWPCAAGQADAVRRPRDKKNA